MLFLNDLAYLNSVTCVLAYVDPGIGSYIFQIMIAGIAAVGFFFGAMKTRVKSMFGKKSDKKPSENIPAEKIEEADATSHKR